MFNLFKKKCEYCNKVLNKNGTVKRKVKVPEFVEMKERNFCCDKHAKKYDKAVRNLPRRVSMCSSCPTPPSAR